jgi:hypothetical protein
MLDSIGNCSKKATLVFEVVTTHERAFHSTLPQPDIYMLLPLPIATHLIHSQSSLHSRKALARLLFFA